MKFGSILYYVAKCEAEEMGLSQEGVVGRCFPKILFVWSVSSLWLTSLSVSHYGHTPVLDQRVVWLICSRSQHKRHSSMVSTLSWVCHPLPVTTMNTRHVGNKTLYLYTYTLWTEKCDRLRFENLKRFENVWKGDGIWLPKYVQSSLKMFYSSIKVSLR